MLDGCWKFLWDNKFQAAIWDFCDFIVSSRTRSFTVKTNESCRNSRAHSIPSLEGKKNVLFNVHWKCIKWERKKNFWLTGSTNGVSIQLCHKWNDFCLFGTGSGVLDCDCWINFLKNGNGLRFSELQLVSFANQYVPSPQNNIIVNFWSLKGIFNTWEQALHISNFVGWKVSTLFVWAYWTKDLSNNIWNWFLRLSEIIGTLTKLEEKRNSYKWSIAHLTFERAMRTLIVASAERFENFFLQSQVATIIRFISF